MLEHQELSLDQHLQQLQLYCRHHSNHLLAGHYHSAFKGQGIEFDEVRPYAIGDDVRAIDWNVSARSGDLYIKRFHEERELNLIFVIDNSPSFSCSTGTQQRPLVAAKFCGLLGSAAIANNDRIGLLSFSESFDDYLAPAKGRSQLMRCLSHVLHVAKSAKYTSVSAALEHLSQLKLKRSIVVVISDFFTVNTQHSDSFEQSLARLNSQHQLLAIAIDDANELNLPASGLIQLQDSENQESRYVDLSSKKLREDFQQQMQQRITTRAQTFANAGVDFIAHALDDDPVTALLGYFNTRHLRVTGETGG
ncbi:DUF58 domain-containing protein [Thalassotalea sp. PLHSN55]|uniref:DUF58 domain-containing protein n=1 Tax=Thalassotalea sp. PLHSN55 TaxID=3435888 RepID=UPI003F8613FE